MADAAEATRRHALLASPHMRPLAEYVGALNAAGRGWAPQLDPHDGGAEARLLLLLEKPGPGLHSGFVSRDNDTPTGRTIRRFMQAAAVPREGTIIWNLVPWWNGTMAVRSREARDGAAQLSAFLPLLPRLRTVVLAGRLARLHAAPLLAGTGLHVVGCVHPSPNARAGPASSAAWQDLPKIWRAAWLAASAPQPHGPAAPIL